MTNRSHADFGDRLALLIGVPECESRPDLNLKCVAQDIAEMQQALEKCNYKVKTVGTDEPHGATFLRIPRLIREVCQASRPGSTLIIYFSGHGIHWRGRDLLVPWDADFDRDDLGESLFAADIANLVSECRAATIVFFVDACREGVNLTRKPVELTRWSSQQYSSANGRCFVTVLGCSAGQYSHYVSTDPPFSIFTRAIATVMSPSHAAETLGEVLAAVQEEVDRLGDEYQKPKQVITRKLEDTVEGQWAARIISNYRPAAEDERKQLRWAEAVRHSSLWTNSSERQDQVTWSAFREAATSFASAAQKIYHEAAERLPGDPWRDEGYVPRVLDLVRQLARNLDDAPLNAAETALILIAAPMREALHASALLQTAECDPLELTDIGDRVDSASADLKRTKRKSASTVCDKLQLVHQMQPRLVRAASRLSQGKTSDRDRMKAILAWLMHEFVNGEPSFWQFGAITTLQTGRSAHSADLAAAIQGALSDNRHLELSKCLGSDPRRIERQDTASPLRAVAVEISGSERTEIREWLLAYVLTIAGWMALDVRKMPGLVADQVGSAIDMRPVDLLTAIAAARWRSLGTGRQLEIECVHPAVDFAIRDHVDRAAEALEYIRERADTIPELAALSGLPTRLTASGVRPTKDNTGRPAYELPHVSFSLAPEEIREMLMGVQLYKEPELAVRELYQNALDACRYRRARIEFLRQRGALPSIQANWTGKIRFRHGKTRAGRSFLECIDNGVGMSKAELSNCFARAGRRFRDLPEFLEERAIWLSCSPPISFYPNSQFGIGVFSYFMLADELEVITCRFDQYGNVGHRLIAHMSAGGGLFRVQDLGPGDDAGTHIRLYLKDKHNEHFLSEVLSEHLCVAEFETVVDDVGQQLIWKPGVPRLRDKELSLRDRRRNPPSPIFGHQSTSPFVSWGPVGYGEVLADGIRVKCRDQLFRHFGAVVNLTGEHFPRLTVDRRDATNWDEKWASEITTQSIASLADSPHLSLCQLWIAQRRFDCEPSIMQNICVGNPTIRLGSLERSCDALCEQSSLEYDHSFRDGKRALEFMIPQATVEAVGVDWRDFAILGWTITFLDKEASDIERVNEIERLMRGCKWIGYEYYSYDAEEGAASLLDDFQIFCRAALEANGTAEQFRGRVEKWARSGLAVPPSLQLTAGLPSDGAVEFQAAVRQYQSRRHSEERLAAIREHGMTAVIVGGIIVVILGVAAICYFKPEFRMFLVLIFLASAALFYLGHVLERGVEWLRRLFKS